MSHAGLCLSNPVTGERAVVRIGDADPDYDGVSVTELFLPPGGQVALAHIRPTFADRFTPVEGDFRVKLDGDEQRGELGRTYDVRPGMTHDFWNAGSTEAHIIVEIEDLGERLVTSVKLVYGWAPSLPAEYAQLTKDDVREALRFAAANVDQRVMPLDQTA